MSTARRQFQRYREEASTYATLTTIGLLATLVVAIVALFYPASLDTGLTISALPLLDGCMRLLVCERPRVPNVCTVGVDRVLADKVVCNGTDATELAIAATSIAFNSTACEFGGIQLVTCRDADGNGECGFPPDTLLSNETLCNSGVGEMGISVGVTSAPAQCSSSNGTTLSFCRDVGGTGDCSGLEDAILLNSTVCNGVDGIDGRNGTGGIFCADYRFKTATTDEDPGNNNMRFNSVVQNDTTALYISTTDLDMREIGEILELAQTGSYLFVRSNLQPQRYFFFAVNADAELLGGIEGYVRFSNVTRIASGGDELVENEALFLCVQFQTDMQVLFSQEEVEPTPMAKRDNGPSSCVSGGTRVTACVNLGWAGERCDSTLLCRSHFDLPIQHVAVEAGASVDNTSYNVFATLTSDAIPGGIYEVHWQWDALVDVLGLLSIVCLDGTAADCSDGSVLDGPTIRLGTGVAPAQVSGFAMVNVTDGAHTIHLAHSRESGILTAPTVSAQRIIMRYAAPT